MSDVNPPPSTSTPDGAPPAGPSVPIPAVGIAEPNPAADPTVNPTVNPCVTETPTPAAEPRKPEDYLNRKDLKAPPDPCDVLFDDRNLVRGMLGEECDLPLLEEWVKSFTRARCVIVAGPEPKHALWTATCLADRLSFAKVYASTSTQLAALTTPQIFAKMAPSRDPLCVIIDQTGLTADRAFASYITSFDIGTRGAARTPHGYIVCVKPQAIDLLKGDCPEHVPVLHLPELTRAPETAVAGALPPAQYIQRIFAPPLDFGTIHAEQNEWLIPKALIRIAVLFPGLSTSNFDALVKTELGDATLELAPAKDRIKAKTGTAAEVWASYRPSFEHKAGLTREGSQTSATLRFLSPELEAAAQDWVWRYPEDLYDLFAAISRQGVLFSDHLDQDEQEMYLKYIDVAVQLARRAPKLFGGRWLETLFQEFADWVRRETPEAERADQEGDVLTLLLQLAGQEKRKRFWSRFANRMAVLCGNLWRDGSDQIVTRFFERLSQRQLHELILDIIDRMGEAMPAEARLGWIERILNSGDTSARAAAVCDLAWKILSTPSAASPYLEAFSHWASQPPVDGRSMKYEAGLALPMRLFQIGSQRKFDPEGATSPLLTLLQLPLPAGGTVLDYCQAAVAQPLYRKVASTHLVLEQPDEEEREFMALALSLFQCADGLPNGAQESALRLARAAVTPLKLSEQNRVGAHWKGLAEYCMKNMPRSTAPAPELRRRAELGRSLNLVNALIRYRTHLI